MSDADVRLRAALEVLFDPVDYASRNAGRLAPGEAPLEHFLSVGLRQGLSPHPLFDAPWYAAKHGVSAAESPFLHFVTHGEPAGLAPGPCFDVAWYRRTNPDVAAAGVNSLVHYVEFGRGEGRLASPMFDPATPAGALGAWVLEGSATEEPHRLLSHAPSPTTLARLMTGKEATSFLQPETVRQILVRTRPAPPAGPIAPALVVGGARGVLFEEGSGVLMAPGLEPGWALAHVTHAVAPSIDAAVHLLGLGAPRDADQLDRWAAEVGEATRQTASPHLLIDESLPPEVSARLCSAAGPGSTAFRVPARRLLAVHRLTAPGLEGSAGPKG